MLDNPIVIAPLTAFLIGLCAVPAVRRMALAFGFLDSPDQRRKHHSAAIALGGGIAVWLASWSGWGVSLLGASSVIRGEPDAGRFIAALWLATLLILGLGVIDDWFGLRARHKLAGQVVAAVVLVSLGLRIDVWSCFGVELKLGIFAYPVTVFWIVLIVNALNLVDGMDGFCGSLGLIASLAIAFLAYRSARIEDAIVALALAGALAAFLAFNLPPARIYLGDAGSMMIGMMISALSVRSCTYGRGSAVALLPMIALLMLPLLDVVTAVGRRWLKGRSIFIPDRGHIHHCLSNRLGSAVATLGAALLLATLGAGGAVLATTYGMGDKVACVVVALSVGLLTCTNTFGATESRLLLFRLKVALTPLSPGLAVRGRGIGQECHLRGNRDWAGVWHALIREGEASGVWRIELAIEMTAAGEVYHGHWSLPTAADDEPHWSIVHTLYAGDALAGMISVSGNVDACGSPYLDKVEKLVRVVEDQLVPDNAPVSSSETLALSNVNLSVNSALTSVVSG
jgi:UDP-GlcNAc:undecaprenyl-phosphate/decaprenyl-phosphate GlcNAc-1-phosphate transferase